MKKIIILFIVISCGTYLGLYFYSSSLVSSEMEELVAMNMSCGVAPSFDVTEFCSRLESLESVPITPGFAAEIDSFQEFHYIFLVNCFSTECCAQVSKSESEFRNRKKSMLSTSLSDSVITLEDFRSKKEDLSCLRSKWSDRLKLEFRTFLEGDTAFSGVSKQWHALIVIVPAMPKLFDSNLIAACAECDSLLFGK